ncbi:MAG: uroporphyrinogen decarboxylase family protein [Candidatus Thorarchaeota archaeon]
MSLHNINFLKALSKEIPTEIPLYCTGYPEIEFIENYIKQYDLKINENILLLNNKNYSIIKKMGFDAVSLWDYRRGEGGFFLENNRKVDSWGRIYSGEWYLWDGVFKSEDIISEWNHLNFPSQEKLLELKSFLIKDKNDLEYVISLPGLFEKTWQSMGFYYFSKCLKKNQKLIEFTIDYFYNYLKELIIRLQNTGAYIFLVADDFGYKNRIFIPKEILIKLFFERYRRIVELIHRKNQFVILHSDGYISDLIEYFIDLEFDAVQSLEPNAGVNIFSLFKRYNNQICFIGNLDISLLSFGNPIQVKCYVMNLIRKAKQYNCSLVISPTQQINSKCQTKNINTMIKTTKIFK